MTSPRIDIRDLVSQACRTLGLDTQGMTLSHQHATGIYMLPRQDAVVRVSSAGDASSLDTSLRLLRWLIGRGFPATEPLDVTQPFTRSDYTLTFWRHYPQPDGPPPPAGYLGELLRELHDLPQPPIVLQPYQPLTQLRTIIENSSSLPSSARSWLQEAIEERLTEYNQLHFPLGHGFIHGDAYPGNTLWDGQKARLGDWDEAGSGPREFDLANTFQGVRFGRSEHELRDFATAYQRPMPSRETLHVLTGMRDLHTLGVFIRKADGGNAAAAVQLHHRLATLRDGDLHARWDIP